MTARRERSPEPTEARGLYRVGWLLFLALVAITPLIIGAFPTQTGPLAPIRTHDPIGLPKAVAILVLAGLSLLAFCLSAIRDEAQTRWHSVMWVVTAFVAWAGVSTIFAKSRSLAVWGSYARNEGLVALLGYAVVAFLAVQYVRSMREIRAVAVVGVVSGCLVSAYAFVQSLGIDVYEWVGELSRVTSTMGNADMLGNYLIFPLALALGLAFTVDAAASGWDRYKWWAAVALIGYALWKTQTRGAWVGAAVMVLAFSLAGWYHNWNASRGRKIAFAGIAIGLLLAVFVAIVLTRPALGGQQSVLDAGIARATNGRSVIWLTAVKAWLARPVTGWGPDAFLHAFESKVGSDWYAITPGTLSSDNAHSIFVQTLVTLGLPGLLLLVWALVRTAVSSFRALPESGPPRLMLAALWSGFVGMVAALSLGVTMPELTVWMWLMLGMLLASTARRVTTTPKGVLVAAGSIGALLAVWAASWLVADVMAGYAMKGQVGADQAATLAAAKRVNPLAQEYRWLHAEALAKLGVEELRGGQPTGAETLARAVDAYAASAAADPEDMLLRIAYAEFLLYVDSLQPGAGFAQKAVVPAEEARQLGPTSALALVSLAKVYAAAGMQAKAVEVARLARSIAPEYSMQTLGELGAETGTTP